MQRILSKRVLRDIRENLLRYLALFFLVAMVMYMVVAIVGASETIMQGTEESAAVHHREDGQFGVFVPLTDSEVTQITDKGVTVQQDFSLDFHQGQATLRRRLICLLLNRGQSCPCRARSCWNSTMRKNMNWG